jgi:hypothetical protein
MAKREEIPYVRILSPLSQNSKIHYFQIFIVENLVPSVRWPSLRLVGFTWNFPLSIEFLLYNNVKQSNKKSMKCYDLQKKPLHIFSIRWIIF